MTKRATFTQADLARAISAAEKAGKVAVWTPAGIVFAPPFAVAIPAAPGPEPLRPPIGAGRKLASIRGAGRLIHYHGTPISPVSVLMELAGRHFCVSHIRPDDVKRAHQIGQSVMLDNGAFSKWKSGKETNWREFYEWCDVWLDYPATWAVIPDVIDAGTQEQDALLREWPHGHRGAPVWHMDEPISRLLRLCDEWPRVCVGSTAEYASVLSGAWCRRMDEAWNEVSTRHRRLPWLHMLRGMQLSGMHYPFASVDSTDIAQNHHLPHRSARKMADRWDAMQTPARWDQRPQQMDLAV